MQNASIEQEIVWDKFLYCVDVKLTPKFILSIYEVKELAAVYITTNSYFIAELICSIYMYF
jgi:hypothetical protein